MSDIRLVIWDMDETFWNGVLSEGSVSIPSENINIVKELSDRGIVNSICSKNNYDAVKAELQKTGIWDLFVYPKISWEPKGAQIKDIAEWSNLRPETILFIDDNPTNLNEAKFYVPQILTESPDFIPQILDDKRFLGKDDAGHSRLNQYKVLEKKAIDKKKYETNEDFLYNSKIQVHIINAEDEQKERIFELINRTNQLNFTKIRLERMLELDTILNSPQYECGCVSVSDKYGDYGVVGFFAKEGDRLIHFLFSCRTIGLGVEQYVYAMLGYPKIECVGDTAVRLNETDFPKWINNKADSDFITNFKSDTCGKKQKCLFIGGCDLEQVLYYLEGNSLIELTAELNYCSGDYNVHREHSEVLREALELNENEKEWIIRNTPFYDEKVFDTTLKDTEYDVIIYSPLIDYSLGVYEHIENKNYKVAFANFDRPLDKQDNSRVKNAEDFLKQFKFIGRTSPQRLIDNLKFIRNKVGNHPLFIIINGSEVDIKHPEEINRYLVHKEMNLVIDRFVEEDIRARLIDVRNIVTSEKQHLDTIRHYTRNVYYEMAKQINELLAEEKISAFALTDKYDAKKSARKILKTFLRKIGIYKAAYTIYRKVKK